MADATPPFADPPMAGRRRWLAPVLAPLRPYLGEVLLVSFFVNLLALATPVYVLQVYDRVVFHAGLSTLTGLTLGMAGVVVFDFLLRGLRARLMQRVALRVDVRAGQKLDAHLAALPLAILEARPASHWQGLHRDLDLVRNTLGGGIALLAADLPFVFLFIGLVFLIAQPVAWILVIAFAAFFGLAVWAGFSVGAVARAERTGAQARDTLLAERLLGRTTVKALAMEHALAPAWEKARAETIDHAVRRGQRQDRFVHIGHALGVVTTVSMTTVGALAIIDHQMTIGSLIAANMLGGRLLAPLNQLVGGWRGLIAARQAAARLGEAFALPTEPARGAVELPRPAGHLTVENLTFRFAAPPAPPVLDGLALTIRPGGITAIMGRNGCGKTTLLKLLIGLYRPAEGRVLLDGADIGQFGRHDLAAWVGYAPQECVLLAGSIRDNIALGAVRGAVDDAAVVAAARLAGVHDAIAALPEGYGTPVGEGGGRLSAGIRQRLVLARALIGEPPLIVLDEPTASLDSAAERGLAETLRRLAAERTVVVVSHSPVLLQAARTIFVLEQGRLAASGPAAEVLAYLSRGSRS
ncbi:peptidase domain-containing ABC transporter [Roseospirillum parvum]|nr:peptidase domain-containing ABC transporter [Roseospirillum parvum]